MSSKKLLVILIGMLSILGAASFVDPSMFGNLVLGILGLAGAYSGANVWQKKRLGLPLEGPLVAQNEIKTEDECLCPTCGKSITPGAF